MTSTTFRHPASAWHAALLALLVCVGWLYWPVLGSHYVWDDFPLFVNNAWLKAGVASWDVLSRPILPGSAYFRPVVLLSFVTEFGVLGSDPSISHAINLGLFLTNILLIHALASGLFVKARVEHPILRASLAALLYAVHPALTESAAWISGRFDLLLTTFVLLALNCEVHVRRKCVRNILFSGFFLAALGSKESAIVLPAALLLLRIAHDRQPHETLVSAVARITKAEQGAVLSLGLTFIAYVVAKAIAFDALIQVGRPEGVDTVGGYLLLVLNTLVFYIKLVVAPFSLISPIYPLEDHNVFSASNGIIGLVAIGVFTFALRLASKGVVAGFMMLSAGVALLPVLNIVPLSITDNIGHCRFLTLPLVFFSLTWASLPLNSTSLLSARAKTLVLAIVVVGWSAMAVVTTRSIIPLWNNSNTLWSWAYATTPESRLAAAQFAVSALRSDRPDLAGTALERIKKKHGSFTFHEQLFYSEYLIRIGRREEARLYLNGITATLPRYHDEPDETAARSKMQSTSAANVLESAYLFLAILDAMESRPEQSVRNIRAALWYQPLNPQLLIAAAIFHQRFDRNKEADEFRRKAKALVGEEALPAIEKSAITNLRRHVVLAAWFTEDGTLQSSESQ